MAELPRLLDLDMPSRVREVGEACCARWVPLVRRCVAALRDVYRLLEAARETSRRFFELLELVDPVLQKPDVPIPVGADHEALAVLLHRRVELKPVRLPIDHVDQGRLGARGFSALGDRSKPLRTRDPTPPRSSALRGGRRALLPALCDPRRHS